MIYDNFIVLTPEERRQREIMRQALNSSAVGDQGHSHSSGNVSPWLWLFIGALIAIGIAVGVHHKDSPYHESIKQHYITK